MAGLYNGAQAGVGESLAGLGGVWFTGSTNFDAVTRADQRVIPAAGSEYAPYTEDVYRYALVMAAEPVKQNLNVMTYLGYPATGDPAAGSGTGLDPANCFKRASMVDMGSYTPYLFNRMQFYTMRSMPPVYTPTNQVYIILHGDGVTYSKAQLSEVYREPGAGNNPSLFVMQVRHALVE
jgi:hypothetical protein